MHIKIIEKNELKMYKELGYSIVEIGIPLSFQNITSMINENSIESWEFSVGCVSTPITEKYFSNYKDEMAIYMQKHKDDPFTRQNPCELFELFLSKHTKDLTYTIIKPIYFAKKNKLTF